MKLVHGTKDAPKMKLVQETIPGLRMMAVHEVIPGLGMRAVQGTITGEELITLILRTTVQRWIAGDVNFPFDVVTFFQPSYWQSE